MLHSKADLVVSKAMFQFLFPVEDSMAASQAKLSAEVNMQTVFFNPMPLHATGPVSIKHYFQTHMLEPVLALSIQLCS